MRLRIARGFWHWYLARVNAEPSLFWNTQPGLVWSNPKASDSVHIRAALQHPRFGQLLEIALEFGLDRLCEEWAVLQRDGTQDTELARAAVERILLHLSEGFSRAAT